MGVDLMSTWLLGMTKCYRDRLSDERLFSFSASWMVFTSDTDNGRLTIVWYCLVLFSIWLLHVYLFMFFFVKQPILVMFAGFDWLSRFFQNENFSFYLFYFYFCFLLLSLVRKWNNQMRSWPSWHAQCYRIQKQKHTHNYTHEKSLRNSNEISEKNSKKLKNWWETTRNKTTDAVRW